ncbi:hypothetical protein BGZ83_007761 [Gryganskiella cystojenkinii]|nr:hypothetical protein BGZ83_007761 [Gryganskiella cystojenkinii]
MSLFHSKPVTVQRTYYKPSTMSRLKAVLSGRPAPRPRAVATQQVPQHRRRRQPVRQPVRKNGLFHRTPRQNVVAAQRRPGFFGSLRNRRAAPAQGRHHHGKHHNNKKHDKHESHKGRNLLALLAIMGLKRKHDHKQHHKQAKRHHHHHL